MTNEEFGKTVQSLALRVRRVYRGLLLGSSEKEIAYQVGASVHTVHEHVKDLHRRFGVNSRGELLSAVIRYLASFSPPNPIEELLSSPPHADRPSSAAYRDSFQIDSAGNEQRNSGLARIVPASSERVPVDHRLESNAFAVGEVADDVPLITHQRQQQGDFIVGKLVEKAAQAHDRRISAFDAVMIEAIQAKVAELQALLNSRGA